MFISYELGKWINKLNIFRKKLLFENVCRVAKNIKMYSHIYSYSGEEAEKRIFKDLMELQPIRANFFTIFRSLGIFANLKTSNFRN